MLAARFFRRSTATITAQGWRAYYDRRTLLTLGIRAEDKNRWERRVPLIPEHVERLVTESGAKVLVQPSTKRVITDEQYALAGATITEDLTGADLVLGVKEVPVDKLLPGRSYMFFSHTHKGQPAGMDLLKNVLEKKIRLIDYELITDEDKRRLVLFSKFAGYAGMIDSFHGLGQRLLALGFGTPFLSIGMSYMYRCVADARLDVTRTGQVIMDEGLAKGLAPMVFVFTGDGNVTRGALHVFKCLPHEWVKPEDLEALFTSGNYDHHKVYGCQVRASDYLVRADGTPGFDKAEYKAHPERYTSVFHERIAPYATMLVNGIFWDQRYPRLLSRSQIRKLASEGRLRLQSIADISCDINGSLEFMDRASSIDQPFFMYDPMTDSVHYNPEGNGVQIMSIDNLPTEMPLEASEYFSNALFPFVREMIHDNFDHPVVKRAIISELDGKLVGRHAHLYDSIAVHAKESGVRQKVLLLGSGYVSAPVVDYLLRDSQVNVTIGTNKLEEADALAAQRDTSRVRTAVVNVTDPASLDPLIAAHDIVVSLVPATFHVPVAEACIRHKTHMVTASYTSPAMAELNKKAKDANITILNEIGLDPGIDHLTAMEVFDDVRRDSRNHISSFVSWCGGLPAPEASNNPLGYKFSWSPRGVLLASKNGAKYRMGGKDVEIQQTRLLNHFIPDVPIFRGLAFEGVPNRDSLSYSGVYGFSAGDLGSMDTFFRGTLRYKGFSDLMQSFIDLGLLNDQRLDGASTWPQVLDILIGGSAGSQSQRLDKMARKLSQTRTGDQVDEAIKALEWLGATDPSTSITGSTVLDVFCSLLESKLKYEPGERDMVCMHHEFCIQWHNGPQERRTSTLIAYGDPNGYSAMAKTVGMPVAIATKLILDGVIERKGVLAPVTSDIYQLLLKILEEEGISMVEKTEVIKK
ncbi:Saccharopine dehydrogenase-domain-containing protein [Cladochytrium replicatum]|nr:Saccharopine dehydrogenase-domain-containing protein [Cladochytrium replicatum]